MSASAPDRFWRDWNSRGGVQVPQGGMTLIGNSAIKSGQTSYNVGTGFWLGMVNGVAKFSIGNSSGNKLVWDGSSLSITGALSAGTITGTGIDVSTTGYVRGGKTGYANGTTGFWIGYAGGYVFDIGSTTNYLRWTGSSISLVGDISGTSSIDITGTAKFGGSGSMGSYTSAVGVNESLTASTGLLAYAGNSGTADYAVRAFGGSYTNSGGVFGSSTAINGIGVYGACSTATGYGVYASNTGGGNALVVAGTSNFSGQITGNLTGNVTGNVTGSSGSCTGNAATATTSAACSGNSATATTAAACSGNSATATTAGDVTNAGGAKLICGTYNTNMQTDGNLVVYHGATPYWDATTDLSDGKFKEAIVPTKHAGLDVVNGLRVVDYKWKQDIPVTIKNKDKLKTGFIAQEVQALVPDAVNDIDGTLLLHKEELVPYLVKAVQELSEQVKAMQIEIQALKSK
jgi:hypothetical protein